MQEAVIVTEVPACTEVLVFMFIVMLGKYPIYGSRCTAPRDIYEGCEVSYKISPVCL